VTENAVLLVGRREHPEGRVSARGVVEDLDVVEDGGSQLGAVGPGLAADELLLERGEEALGDGVVPAGNGEILA
jgi:hypothetical protein